MKTPREQVLEIYPDAEAIKIKRHYEVHTPTNCLGKGKNKKCAWKSASNNINR